MKHVAVAILLLFADQRPVPRVRGVLITASWCGPCKTFKRDEVPRLTRSRWRVGDSESDHLQILDYESREGAGYKAIHLPTFIRVVDGKEVARREGFIDAMQLAEFVYPTK